MRLKIGISFSSRNRPDTLDICLTQLYRQLTPDKYDYYISVVNDLGDPAFDGSYAQVQQRFSDVLWHRAEERQGIAKVKNEGIRILKSSGCDHFFLFDDDAFPVKKGWEELYISLARTNNVHHFMHQFPLPAGFSPERTANGICEYAECCGMMLYFTRHAIDTLGGYRKDFGIYGYEHAEISGRCHFAGLQSGWGPYISPENTREYIYSLDLELNHWGNQPPDFEITPGEWRSSIQGEDVQQHIDYNARIFGRLEPIFEEI